MASEKRRSAAVLLLAWTVLLLAWSLGGPAGADEAAQGGAASRPEAPRVGLDKLLELPDSLDYSVDNRGGATRGEWRARFTTARQALEAERSALDRARAELERVAGSAEAWQIGPPLPGAPSPGESPLDYRLRQEIRDHRREIERLEQEVRNLELEANLAGVPEDWRN